MATITRSFAKVPYDLRPAKQVERRMLLDAFQRLTRLGFQLPTYTYVGFGSVFFYDFILFHRYLGISKMISIEHDETIEKRCKFNRPYNCVSVEIDDAGSYIGRFNPDEKAIVWLDFDDYADNELLSAVEAAANRLALGSIILATFDASVPKTASSASKTFAYFKARTDRFLDDRLRKDDFQESKLATRAKDFIVQALHRGVSTRQGVHVLPIVSFEYADGHLMYTFGAIIGDDEMRDRLRSLDLDGAKYFRLKLQNDIFRIKVPVLTRKERLLLDQRMASRPPRSVREFEIDEAMLEQYFEIFRFMPSYAELLA